MTLSIIDLIVIIGLKTLNIMTLRLNAIQHKQHSA
jgi:hypothetical protein